MAEYTIQETKKGVKVVMKDALQEGAIDYFYGSDAKERAELLINKIKNRDDV